MPVTIKPAVISVLCEKGIMIRFWQDRNRIENMEIHTLIRRFMPRQEMQICSTGQSSKVRTVYYECHKSTVGHILSFEHCDEFYLQNSPRREQNALSSAPTARQRPRRKRLSIDLRLLDGRRGVWPGRPPPPRPGATARIGVLAASAGPRSSISSSKGPPRSRALSSTKTRGPPAVVEYRRLDRLGTPVKGSSALAGLTRPRTLLPPEVSGLGAGAGVVGSWASASSGKRNAWVLTGSAGDEPRAASPPSAKNWRGGGRARLEVGALLY